MAARAVTVVGCYAPPFTDAIWRRALGTLSGLCLLVLSIAWGRGWTKRTGTSLEDARAEGWFAATGVVMGTILALAWAAGFVAR